MTDPLADHRYDRQVALFGAEGQRCISAARVCIVGLGGLGSHVAQQLAYLGVMTFTLTDGDHVTASNLNRLVGGLPHDAVSGAMKVDIAKRTVSSIQPRATVLPIPEWIDSQAAVRAIQSTDLVFGCLDRDLPRLQLTELCARFKKPYFDLATDIDSDAEPLTYGGRILFANAGDRCLVCMGMLSQRQMARDSMTDDERQADDRLYGVDRTLLADSGPSVVSINGVVASIAVTEFMAWATGLRTAFPHLVYRADRGRVTLSTDLPVPDCYYCLALWGGQART